MQIKNSAQISYNNPSFEKLPGYYKIGNYCLNKIGKEINPVTVKKTSCVWKMLLRKFTPARIKEMAQVTVYIANELKSYFDKLYGAGNYTLISIGRSVSAIAEAMQSLGADTKIIPLSGLRRGLPNNIQDLDVYKEYLSCVGINEQNFENNPKRKFVIIDYVSSGNTLNSALVLMRNKIFSSSPKNLSTCPINNIIKKAFKNGYQDLFAYCSFKNYSPVGKLDIHHLKDCFSQSKVETAKEYKSNAALYMRNLFRFHVSDKLNHNQTGYISPLKEFEAIFKHFKTPNSVRQRMLMALENMEKLIGKLGGNKQG